ncbi:hypothetical protein TNIN_232321 [Trichonephila inaurata madagascariensis]|uniref:Secreted protein n=1 Tax=Trichonephila inaurata madagascariensis TaxID=2747483 RepID=A0A8X6XZH5_9ARAC|nr:hypothetical protein TNIN_232321 [Trichonephila inaurata madagascariensis]
MLVRLGCVLRQCGLAFPTFGDPGLSCCCWNTPGYRCIFFCCCWTTNGCRCLALLSCCSDVSCCNGHLTFQFSWCRQVFFQESLALFYSCGAS